MPKVSIIIPFNNVETYIEQCLNSVVNQTLKDIEIICIDDASTDSSKEIVKRFMSEDARIKLIEIPQRNGQGFARNRAIEIAQGEYIGFVDSDDWVEEDMFELLYNSAKENDNDITICQAREYDDINEKYILTDYYSLSHLERMGNSVFAPEDIKNELLDINVVLWNKIYKKTYLDEIGEKFPEGFIYEDLPFFFGTFLPANRVQIVWKNLYIYRVNRKNSTMQQFNNKILDRVPMVSLTFEKMKKYDFLNDMKMQIQAWIINDLFHRYTLLKEHYQKEFFFMMKKVFQSLEIENIEDLYWARVYHFQGYLLVLNNNFEDFNQKVFNEYLDFHEMENRLCSKITSTQEVDEKISKVYEEISKNYEYTKNLVSEVCEKETTKTDEKISKIYEEISKNYDYTNEIRDDFTHRFDAVISEKISNIHSDINDKVSLIYEKMAQNYESINSLLNSKENNVNNKIKKTNENAILVIDDKLEKEKKVILSEINSNQESINTELEKQKAILTAEYENKIKELENSLIAKINLQKIEYEKKIEELESQVKFLAQNPIKRIIKQIKKGN